MSGGVETVLQLAGDEIVMLRATCRDLESQVVWARSKETKDEAEISSLKAQLAQEKANFARINHEREIALLAETSIQLKLGDIMSRIVKPSEHTFELLDNAGEIIVTASTENWGLARVLADTFARMAAEMEG